MVASAAIPLLAWADYLRLVPYLELAGMSRHRPPVPPERFYWTFGRIRLRRMLVVEWRGFGRRLGVGLEISGRRICRRGRRSSAGRPGSVAIVASARFCSSAIAYVRASQWFDKMTPWAIGFCRRSLYRLSENPDFLAPENPRRREEEKSIY